MTDRARRIWPAWIRRIGVTGTAGALVLVVVTLACLLTLPYTLGADDTGVSRFNAGEPSHALAAPSWVPGGDDADQPFTLLGTDVLGRSLWLRVLAGGGVSLAIGTAAAFLAVVIGTAWGAVAAYAGGRVDAIMMRMVDVLYGLPYILLVVLLAVAADAVLTGFLTRAGERDRAVEQAVVEVLAEQGEASPDQASIAAYLTENPAFAAEQRAAAFERFPPRDLTASQRGMFDAGVLLVAIGGVSWLTMARVVRGQVLSLRAQPFVEAARAAGAGPVRILRVHILPNLVGPIVVYATLAVPQAILQESFLSFLGIGVKPPLPSWGNLAADGLPELNTHRSHWWLLLFPSLLLGITLLSLNFVGDALRNLIDPRSR